MRFSRRDFVHAGCAIAGTALVPHFMGQAKAGLHMHGVGGIGKVQVNSPLALPTLAFPFINLFKTMDRTWLAVNNTQDGYQFLGTVVGPNITETSMPTQLPTGSGAFYQTVVYVYLIPAAQNDVWVMTWDGPGGFFQLQLAISVAGINVATNNVSNNRTELTITNTGSNPDYTPLLGQLDLQGICGSTAISSISWSGGTVSVTTASPHGLHNGSTGVNISVSGVTPSGYNGYQSCAITGASTFTYALAGNPGVETVLGTMSALINNIKIFRKSQETLMNGGEVFAPDFVNLWKGWGSIRYMQWMATVNNPVVKWADRPQQSGASWYGNNLNVGAYAGAAALSNNTYTGPTAITGNPSVWTNGMTMQAVFTSLPAYKAITGITNANPASVACSGHGYSNGQVIFFDPGSTSNGVTLNNGSQPTAPTWGSGTTYNKGAIVKGSDNFIYQSQVGSNLNSNPTTYTTIPAKWLAIGNTLLNTCLNGFNFFTVTVVDANNFTIGVDSTSWGTYGTSAGGAAVAQLQAKSGSLPFKPIVSQSGTNQFILNGGGSPIFGTDRLWNLCYDADFDALMLSDGPDANGSGFWGMPVEVLCALSNKLNVSPWFCLPVMADDDYVTNWATTIKNNLNSNLVAYLELSNEVWNGGYTEFAWVTQKAKMYWGNSLPSFPSANYNFYNFSYYGWRFKSIMTNIGTVFSGQTSRINRVMAEWTPQYSSGATAVTSRDRHRAAGTGLSTLNDGGDPSPAPITFADSIAYAPYLEPPRSTGVTSADVWGWGYGNPTQQATALADLDALVRAPGDGNEFTLYDMIHTIAPGWAANAAYELAQLGLTLKIIQYEGGLGFIPAAVAMTGPNPINGVTLTQTDLLNYFIGYYESSYAAAAITDSFNSHKANGGTFPSQYSLTGQWGILGMFAAVSPNEFGTIWPYATSLQSLNHSL